MTAPRTAHAAGRPLAGCLPQPDTRL